MVLLGNNARAKARASLLPGGCKLLNQRLQLCHALMEAFDAGRLIDSIERCLDVLEAHKATSIQAAGEMFV